MESQKITRLSYLAFVYSYLSLYMYIDCAILCLNCGMDIGAILILKKGITTFAKRILTEMANPSDPSKPRCIIELFEELELLVNITQHIYVPKHQLLTDEEKKTLLAKYKLKETQLPRIQIIDPIARFYGLQKGNVCIPIPAL